MMHLQLKAKTTKAITTVHTKFNPVEYAHLETRLKEIQQHITTGCEWTPFALCEDMISKLPTLDGKILVISNIEFAIVLSTKYMVNPANITFVGLCDYSVNRAQEASHKMLLQGMSVIDGASNNFLKMEFDMKFDTVIGNPPYTGGGHKNNLYRKFVEKAQDLSLDAFAFVTPVSWTSMSSVNSKYTQDLINTMIEYRYLDEYFDGVDLKVCYFVSSKKHSNNDVRVTTINSTGLINKSEFSVFPAKSLTENSVVNKIKDVQSNGIDIIVGRLSRREIYNSEPGECKCIVTTGGNGLDLNVYEVKDTNGLVGLGYHKVVFPRVSGFGSVARIKYAGPEYCHGNNVKSILVNSKEEALQLKEFLCRKLVKFVISIAKSGIIDNSKGVFSSIPDVWKQQVWTDEELYTYFKLTQEEISHIENTIK